MAYVPPALRKSKYTDIRLTEGDESPLQTSTPTFDSKPTEMNLPSANDILAHFWPDNDTLEDKSDRQNSTLHASAANPDNLTYVLLFKDANPRWKADHIIFVKSNLELLPQSAATDTSKESVSKEPQKQIAPTSTTSPTNSSDGHHNGKSDAIAVFEQVPRAGMGPASPFEFAGYFRIQNLQYLEPNSPDLARMLEQKWQRKNKYGKEIHRQRDSAAWKKSFGLRWAVIKFEKDEEVEQVLGKPDIKISPLEKRDEHKPKKSVKEMLEEMRLGEKAADPSADKDGGESQGGKVVDTKE